MQVTDKSPAKQSASFSVPLTFGEVQVIRTLIEYSIPRLLAFDRIWDSPSPVVEDNSASSDAAPTYNKSPTAPVASQFIPKTWP